MHRDSLPGRKRFSSLAGSSDALALTRLATEARPLAVFSANALDAGRLLEEIAWFAPQLRACLLPDWETLPYDSFSPHHDLVSERLATLYRIQRGDFDVVFVPAATALFRLCPPSYLAAYTFFLKQGERLDADALRRQLALAGYNAVTQVVTPGEFCFRGGIVDLFPMGSTVPYRLDLDDDVIETIRSFDVDSQRTLYAVPEVRLLPAREFPMDEGGRTQFRGRWRELFEGDPSKRRLYKDVSNGVPAAGVEYYLPLFFDALATIFDYLPEDTTLAFHHDVSSAVQAFWQDAQSRYKMLGGDPDRPLLPPAQLFVPAEEFYTRAKSFARVDLLDASEAEPEQPFASAPLPPLAVDRRAQDPVAALKGFWPRPACTCCSAPNRRDGAKRCRVLPEYGLAPCPL
jgi:transcription-repair coupling factor (superfamily II helicase)